MTTLVVAAHPDDEVLGCGATIARLTAAGEDVHVLILGEGFTSRLDDRETGRVEVDELASATQKAADLLGVSSVTMSGLPDNRFDAVPLLDVVKHVERLVERVAPDVVYTQHGGDLNVDHQTTFKAVLTATRPVPGQVVREVYAFEVNSSTEWAFQRFEPVFRPTVFVDVSATVEIKMQAMEIYAEEVRPFPHPRSIEALRAGATRWGAVAGVAAAEAFDLVRLVR